MKKDSTWARETCFADAEGRKIREYEVLCGANKGKKIYRGIQLLLVDQGRPSVQRIPFEFEFKLGRTLDWCCDNFDSVAEKAVAEWKESQIKAQLESGKEIILPGNFNRK